MLTIDGSMGEGGGQILRIALAWSALRSEPVRIRNIRANRPKPGLKPQHLTTVLALKEITDAKVKGANLGSTDIEFIPSEPRRGSYIFDCGTAGSITLMIQAILPALLKAKGESKVILRGGTDVKWSPPADHTTHALLPALKRMGASLDMKLIRRGYYPKGGGEVLLTVKHSKLRGISLTGGRIEEIRGKVNYSGLPAHVPERMERSAVKELEDYRSTIEIENSKARSPGAAISLVAESENSIIGANALGERGLKAEIVGEKAGKEMREYLEAGAGADAHLADQLLLYAAMAGNSEILTAGVSSHAKTAMELLAMLEDVRFGTEDRSGNILIRVERDYSRRQKLPN